MTEVAYPLAAGAPVVPEIGVPGPRGPGLIAVTADPTPLIGVDGDSAVDWERGLVWSRDAGRWSDPAAIGGAVLAAMRAASQDALRGRYDAQQARDAAQAIATSLMADLSAALTTQIVALVAALPRVDPHSAGALYVSGQLILISEG